MQVTILAECAGRAYALTITPQWHVGAAPGGIAAPEGGSLAELQLVFADDGTPNDAKVVNHQVIAITVEAESGGIVSRGGETERLAGVFVAGELERQTV